MLSVVFPLKRSAEPIANLTGGSLDTTSHFTGCVLDAMSYLTGGVLDTLARFARGIFDTLARFLTQLFQIFTVLVGGDGTLATPMGTQRTCAPGTTQAATEAAPKPAFRADSAAPCLSPAWYRS